MKGLSDAAAASLRASIDRPYAGDRYVVGELLGRGGMGAVYRAFDSVLKRDVALKVLASDADSPAIAERLQHEARILARLEHPGIVAVHDAGLLDDGRPFYVMRLVMGKRLDDYADSAGRGELFRVFLRICDAVGYAHAREVIHRDLTPANVMIGEFGEVLVLDWGVARMGRDRTGPPRVGKPSEGGTTGDGVVLGTPGFMAPEQAVGAAATADSRSDVYGLGAILRFIATASAPRSRVRSRQSLVAQPPPILLLVTLRSMHLPTMCGIGWMARQSRHIESPRSRRQDASTVAIRPSFFSCSLTSLCGW